PGAKAQLAGSSRAKREAVQPSLWDRLVNDLPGLTSEIDGLRRLLEEELGAERVEALLAGSARSIDADADLTAEQRDIEALFNTERFESVPMLSDFEHEQPLDELPPLADFPEVRRSVVNYGVPSFSGRSSRDFDRDTLAREIRAVLATFEPRLKESATTVNVTLGDKSVGLKIEIDAVLIMT
ncbi:MAG: type VI secretion system baseplate subunit TssE, partial [Mesorhizobium sp.]